MWYEVGRVDDVFSGQSLAAAANVNSGWITVPASFGYRSARPEIVEWILDWTGVSTDENALLNVKAYYSEMATGWSVSQAHANNALDQEDMKLWIPYDGNYSVNPLVIDQTNPSGDTPTNGQASVYGGFWMYGAAGTPGAFALPLPSYLGFRLEITTGFTAASTIDVHAKFWAQNPRNPSEF